MGEGGGGDGKSRQPEVKPAMIRWAFFLFSLVPSPVRRFSHPLQTTPNPRILELGLSSLAKRSDYFSH